MRRPLPSRPGFTLLELLIVISIIVILIALSIGVAFKVSQNGKARVTEQVLRVLDTALTSYIEAKGAPPLPYVLDPRKNGIQANAQWYQPIADATFDGGSGAETINSVGLFIVQCNDVPAAAAALKQLDARLLRQWNPEAAEVQNFQDHQATMLTAFDGWGHPIRYVHPIFKGFVSDPNSQTTPLTLTPTSPIALPPSVPPQPPHNWAITQILRNDQNSDAGLNEGNRPYFYSCGPDGNPATTDDNVYLTQPRFQKAQ